jgi:hypothetical protein
MTSPLVMTLGGMIAGFNRGLRDVERHQSAERKYGQQA